MESSKSSNNALYYYTGPNAFYVNDSYNGSSGSVQDMERTFIHPAAPPYYVPAPPIIPYPSMIVKKPGSRYKCENMLISKFQCYHELFERVIYSSISLPKLN